MHFILPKEINGSFGFDEDEDEESKLINIEERNNSWVLYSTTDSKVIVNNTVLDSINIESGNFYILRKKERNYLIYVSSVLDENVNVYRYDKNIDISIGSSASNAFSYNCSLLNDLTIKIHYVNDQLIIERDKNTYIYVNDLIMKNNSQMLTIGDCINIFGLKILISKDILIVCFLLNNNLLINENKCFISKIELSNYYEEKLNDEITDNDLYSEDDYYSKSPRMRRTIKTKELKLSAPPKKETNQELPLILTIGPMLTMGMMSAIMLTNTLFNLQRGRTTIEDAWPSIAMSVAMILSMLLWPVLIRIYNQKMKKKRRAELIEKYSAYLLEKEKELQNEVLLQKEIIVENLFTVDACFNILKNKSINFWDRRIDQSDFLEVRIGKGDRPLDIKVEYPEEGFTIEEDELRKKADDLILKHKYIKDVPVSYSFYKNKLTAIMGDKVKTVFFMNNILLQLLTFYTYEDLKLVVFTNKDNQHNWDYIRYLNHNFNNDKSFRFFASDKESSKQLAEYLSLEVNTRLENAKENSLFKPYYLLIIDDYEEVKRFDFIKTITEVDINLGFSIIILEDRMSKLPSKCDNFITVGTKSCEVLTHAFLEQEILPFYDEINYSINMNDIVNVLSNIPIEFEKVSGSLPESVSFLEMEKVGKVEQLNILNRWTQNDSTRSLKAEVGIDGNLDLMYLDLHEKYHGPHGLIAGMTGSGKSEFIITYILSMAINYSPDDVAFILIDYKGGGLAFAFENKTTGVILPHLAGTITNLDKAEMDRTLVSIDSEAKRRQKIFNEARDSLGESTIDIYKYQRFYKEGKVKEAIPHLFIICDEFAELKSQQPDFMDNLISIARIGRSLGIHLILATQKPSGVVNDQIWSNSKFHICLKVQDKEDSNEMLKRPEAAFLKQPGRFYLQVGYDEYFALGQSGYAAAKYYPADKIVRQVDKSVNFIDDNALFIKSIQADNGIKLVQHGEQISAIMNNIIEVAKKVNKKAKRLWLQDIDEIVLINALEKKYNVDYQEYAVKAIIGEYDAPDKQQQGLLIYDLINEGNTLVFSTDSSDYEMFLSTLIYSTVTHHSALELNYYIIDYGSQSLRKFERFPQFGGYVSIGDDEKYKNLFKMINKEIELRKKLFINYGGEYKNYIVGSKEKLPLKVIVLNNFDSILENDKQLYDDFANIARGSDRYGIVFVLTATSTSSVPRKIQQSFKNIYAYKVKDPIDYMTIFNVRKKIVPKDLKGRGLFYIDDTIYEFQTASILEDEKVLNEYLNNVVDKIKNSNNYIAKKIPELPEQVLFDDVKSKIINLTSVPIGINYNDLEINTFDLKANFGSIITANRLDYLKNFIISFIEVLKGINNTRTILIDPRKILFTKKDKLLDYYYDNLKDVLDAINNYILSTSDINVILIILGSDKLVEQLDEVNKLEEFLTNIKKKDNVNVILGETINVLKRINFDAWFSDNFTTNDGIYIGSGVGDQNVLKISNYSNELNRTYKNNVGFHIVEGSYTKIKLIEFVKDGDNNE